jgi:integrase
MDKNRDRPKKKFTRVAPNLYIQQIGKSRVWVFRYALNHRTHDLGLGPVSLVPADEAKATALEYRRMLLQGRDPKHERGKRDRSKAPTFAECAAGYIATHKPGWRNPKHVYQWEATLKAYAFPFIGHLPVNAIRVEDVLAVLKPIWTTKSETATRVRGRIERVWSSAKALGHCSGDNPAAWEHLQHTLPSPRQIQRVRHHEAIEVEEIPAFVANVAVREGISAKALLFTLLTAARTVETRLATWPEINLDSAIWTIPADRMKAGRIHRVPLSCPLVQLLQSLPRNGPLLFPGAKAGHPLSDMAMLETVREIKRTATTHGLRSSFRDWAARNGYSAELAEKALAHAVKGKAAAAYQRDDLLEQRRPMMEAWALYCIGQPAPQEAQQPTSSKAKGNFIDFWFAMRRIGGQIERGFEQERKERKERGDE